MVFKREESTRGSFSSTVSVDSNRSASWKDSVEAFKLIQSDLVVSKRRSLRRRKLHVSLDESPADIHPTLSRGDFTPEEFSSYWISEQEQTRIKLKCQKILQCDGVNDTGLKYCTRGLERLTETGLYETIFLRTKVCMAVLDAQSFEQSPERIAERYKELTHKSKQAAIRLAELDARGVGL